MQSTSVRCRKDVVRLTGLIHLLVISCSAGQKNNRNFSVNKDKKAVQLQGNSAMPQLFFAV